MHCSVLSRWRKRQTMFVSLSHPKRVPAAPSLLGRVLGLVLLYSISFFNPVFCFTLLFFCVQRHRSAPGPSVLFLLTPVLSIGAGGSVCYEIPISFAVPICHSHYILLYRSCSASPLFFFRRNCSINRCHLACSVEEVVQGLLMSPF